MPRFEGSAARPLDFGEITTTAATPGARHPCVGLRLAVPLRPATRSDKYRRLDLRRRRAQIAARHLLDLAEER
jgi:hypothetical protein